MTLDVLSERAFLGFFVGEDDFGPGTPCDGIVTEDQLDAEQAGLPLCDDEAEAHAAAACGDEAGRAGVDEDRKSTRLNSSH